MNYTENLYYKALMSKYNAQIDEAKAVLKTFFEKEVGVADHPDFMKVFGTYIDQIAEAEENIRVLEDHFSK